MGYVRLDYMELLEFCQSVFCSYGFSRSEGEEIAKVILAADLNGIESHGVQRMARYAFLVETGLVDVHAKPEIIHETPISAVIDAHNAMGQVVGHQAMRLAIQKAKTSGCGMIEVRNSNHYGIAGFYTEMAREEDLMGICMTNTEKIMVPTYGKQPMIGTNPIALSMPADPIPFLFDCATTVVPRGKFEVYAKRGDPVPVGWGVDERGLDSNETSRVLENIIQRAGGGILPLGGSTEIMGGHKGYGLGVIVELFTGILSGGKTADKIDQTGKGAGICQSYIAIDYGLFGNKAEIRAAFSEYLEKIRNSAKAEGCSRIYTHGEKEIEIRAERKANGIPVNEATLQELQKIAADIGGEKTTFPHVVENGNR